MALPWVARGCWRSRRVGYPPHSIETILTERFKVIEGVRSITDLPTLELTNLIRTLSARLASWKKRKEADIRIEPETARQELCSPIAAELPDPFFVGP